MSTARQLSRKEVEVRDSLEAADTGSLQRIADSTEVIANGMSFLMQERQAMQKNLESKENSIKYLRERVHVLEKEAISFRRNVTYYKNRAEDCKRWLYESKEERWILEERVAELEKQLIKR